MSERQLVLVVDDEFEALQILSMHLERDGYKVLTAATGVDALRHAHEHQPDAVILDVKMPGMDGREVCSRLRDVTQAVIILVSVIGDTSEVVRGLKLGADDYIRKPIQYKELAARLEACLRRREAVWVEDSGNPPSPADWRVDSERREVIIGDRRIQLTPKEFEVFMLFKKHPDEVLSSEEILIRAWGPEYLGDQDLVKQFVYRLRSKLEEDPSEPRNFVTIRNAGYSFEPDTKPLDPDAITVAEERAAAREAVSVLRHRAQERAPIILPPPTDPAPEKTSDHLNRFKRARKWISELPKINSAWMLAPTLLLMVFAGMSLVQAAEEALPGDGTYPVKLLAEQAQLLTTFDEARAVDLRLQFLHRRMDEIESLVQAGRTAEIQLAIARLEGQVDQAIENIPRVGFGSFNVGFEGQIEELMYLREQADAELEPAFSRGHARATVEHA